MAIIKCSNCGKEVSDKANACPQCGQNLTVEQESVEETKHLFCEECGTPVAENAEMCPNCGCPLSGKQEERNIPQKEEITAIKEPLPKKKRKNIIIIAAALLVAIVAAFVGNGLHQQKLAQEAAQRREEYAQKLKSVTSTMLITAINAENAGNLIRNVWYNSIYEERDSETDKYTRPNGYFLDDFNDALDNLFSDASFRSRLTTIETEQEQVAKVMKDMKNPPEEFQEAYQVLKELYNAFTVMTNLATNPTGSLTSFTQEFREADSEFASRYDEIQLYIEE